MRGIRRGREVDGEARESEGFGRVEMRDIRSRIGISNYGRRNRIEGREDEWLGKLKNLGKGLRASFRWGSGC